MPSIFSKNCVLSGCIDYYCVICEAQFRNEEETLAHITDEQHKDKWKSCGYFEKYKQDYIKKIKGLYFCELCDMTFPTATKVGLHIDEQPHVAKKDKRRTQFLKRVKDDIVFMDKYVIKEDAWNGFVDDTCVLCNTEFEDYSTHKASRSHILNLIKSKVVYSSPDFAYREIDASSTQCLICNSIFNEHHSSHSESDAHKNSLINVTSENEKEKHNIADSGKDTKTDSETIEDTVLNRDVSDEIGSSNLESRERSPVDLEDVNLKKIVATDYVVEAADAEHGEQWCILCECFIHKDPKSHVNSQHHQTLLKLHKERRDKGTHNSTTSHLYECVEKYQNNNINIDLINETATCKKCVKTIDFNTDAIETHIMEHNKNSNKKIQVNAVPLLSGIKSNGTDKTTLYTKPVLLTAGKDKHRSCSPASSSDTEVEAYAKKHGLSHNRADKSFYCKACCRRLPMTLEELEKHVNSRGHLKNTTKQTTVKHANKAEKVPLTTFVETFEIFEDRSEIKNLIIIIINEKYWLNAFDFSLIGRNCFDVIICHACDVILEEQNVMQHLAMSDTHRDNMRKSFVITSLKDEFVREISENVYHCGSCCSIFDDWDDLLEHLDSSQHERRKAQARNCLRNHVSNPNSFRASHLQNWFKVFPFV